MESFPILLVLLVPVVAQSAFVAPAVSSAAASPAAARIPRLPSPPWPLHGITEWRDQLFDLPGTGDDRRLGHEQGAPPKPVCILPFPYQEVLLQGETKQLRLYEERFIKLFEDCTENHGGVVAMGLIADRGIIQTVPLVEVEAFNRIEGFGIFVTIRAVGRAQLLDVTQQEPYIKAICTEMSDTLPPNLELPNLMASNIERFMVLLSSLEGSLGQLKKELTDGKEDPDDDDVIMKQRIKLAKLEDTFYDESMEENDDEEDGEDDDEEETTVDRRRRFHRAYELALAYDTQGYQTVGQSQSGGKTGGDARTPPELIATSWAVFCTELLPEIDATFRIQALDCDNLFERLKLALAMLKQKKTHLKARLEKAGVNIDEIEGDED